MLRHRSIPVSMVAYFFVVCARDDILSDVLCVTLTTYFGKGFLRHLEFYLNQLNLISTFMN